MRRIAARYSAIASSNLPCGVRAMPRLVRALQVGLEPQCGAVFGDRLIELPLFLEGAAEVGVGSCRDRGLSRSAVRYSAIASSSLPWSAQGDAEVAVGLGEIGLEADQGSRCSAIASSSLPWSCRALPRLVWARG